MARKAATDEHSVRRAELEGGIRVMYTAPSTFSAAGMYSAGRPPVNCFLWLAGMSLSQCIRGMAPSHGSR